MGIHPAQKSRRARRRDRTFVLSTQRRDAHVRRNHLDRVFNVVRPGCACELADFFFAKRSAFGCRCSKRKKGQPKVDRGMCKVGSRDAVFKARHEARELSRTWDFEFYR